MPRYEDADTIRSLSQTQINRLTNAQLREALGAMINAGKEYQSSNAVLSDEIRQLRHEMKQLKRVQGEVKQLSAWLDDAFKIINHQQQFLETPDVRKRRKNSIIYGLQEGGDLDEATKVKTVIKAIQLQDEVNPATWEMRRLGQPNQRRIRPPWISINNQQ